MTQPPRFAPPPSLAPPPSRLFARTPPAIFPPILGLLGLGLAWRRGIDLFGLPAGLAEAFLGAVSLLWAFATLAYLAKLARRPGVVVQDLAILPGRAGLAAGTLAAMLFAAVLGPYAPAGARAVLIFALGAHLAVMALVARQILTGPEEGRVVNPAWHLVFTGPIIGAFAAAQLGLPGLARALFWPTLAVACAIYAVSLVQLIRRIPPAPLRPLLAVHLSVASLMASVAALTGQGALALVFAALGAAMLAGLVAFARWVTAAGFNALWGAFTFPAAAFAGCLLILGGPFAMAGGLALVAATGVVLPIAIGVMQLWARGTLAARTNAAQA